MVEQPAVGRSLRVVKLVDHHEVVGVGSDTGRSIRGQRLDACEDVAPAFRAGATDIQLAEVGVVEHLAVGAE